MVVPVFHKAVGLAVAAIAAAAAAACPNTLSVSYGRPVPDKAWSWRLVANRLSRPRALLFDSPHSLLVLESRTGITRLELTDHGGTCLEAAARATVVQDPDLNHGLALSQDRRSLYASTKNDVYTWAYDPATGTVDNASRRSVVTNMTSGGHTSRTLHLSRVHPGWLVVSRGSQGNDDQQAEDISTGHSQIRAFDIGPATASQGPYDYARDGRLLGWGLRNSVGVGEHPVTGGIWSVENSVDNLARRGHDVHQDNPGEELNFHGYLNGTTDHQGGNYGYPLCYALWSTDNFPALGGLGTGDQFGADRAQDLVQNDTACNDAFVPPELAFQAHTAPLDIAFEPNGTAAYLSFHGSWNRDEPVGYTVAMLDFDAATGRPTAPRNSKDAARPILRNADTSRCPSRCFRPVGLALDAQGRLWFSSDSTGEIFVLARDGGKDSSARRIGPATTMVLIAAGIACVLCYP